MAPTTDTDPEFGSHNNSVSGISDSIHKSNIITFDTSKNEAFRISDNYKTLQRKLKGNWKISSNREDSQITIDILSQSRVFVLAGPREKFTENEVDHLKKYLDVGGSIMVLLGELRSKSPMISTIIFFSPVRQSDLAIAYKLQIEKCLNFNKKPKIQYQSS